MNLCAIHAKCVTIQPRDLSMVRKIRVKNGVDMFLDPTWRSEIYFNITCCHHAIIPGVCPLPSVIVNSSPTGHPFMTLVCDSVFVFIF